MNRESCGSCRFFTRSYDFERDGECRRYPPQVIVWHGSKGRVWPKLSATDWCGEYRSDG